MENLNGMLQHMIHLNAAVPQDQTLYKSRFEDLSQKFNETEAKKNAADKKIQSMRERRVAMEQFIRNLRRAKHPGYGVQRKPLVRPSGICHLIR